MFIYLYGSDSYRRQEKLKEIVAQYQAKHVDVAIQTFDAETQSAALLNALREQSLFGAAKFVVVQNFSELPKEFIAFIIAAFKNVLESKEFIVVVTSDDKPTKDFVFLLKSPVVVQEFEDLTPVAFEEFIKREASRRKVKLTPQLLVALRESFKGDGSASSPQDTWGLVSELNTLALGGNLDEAAAPPVLGFFDIQRFFRSRDIQASLPLLERLLLSQDPAYVFNACAYQTVGVQKMLFADYDVAVKSGKLDYETALLDYIISPLS